MRRLAAAAFVFLLVCSACKHKPKTAVERYTGPLVSVVAMNSPAAEVQLTGGFYPLESNAWRWTGREFSALLARPEHAKENGARLELKFSLPDVVLKSAGPITLSASLSGAKLPPQTYSTPGEQIYATDIPPSALKPDRVTVVFSTDKAMPPNQADSRELAVVALSLGLISK